MNRTKSEQVWYLHRVYVPPTKKLVMREIEPNVYEWIWIEVPENDSVAF